MSGIEKRALRLGYTPLCDCAPLVAAHELGLFAEHGLEVSLERQSSWATSRDLLRIGGLDAAHMLGAVPIAAWMRGDSGIIAPMALSLNGNTIALSTGLFAETLAIDNNAEGDFLAVARALKQIAGKRAAEGGEPLRFAAVFADSSHHIDLRRWLAAGGVDLVRDVRIGIIPPGEVEHFLDRGLIDGFCVGEPWGSLAVSRGVGHIMATSYDLWSNRVEKVLAVGSQFAVENPATLDALLQALIRAGQWVDAPENRAAMASLLVHGGYIDAPIEVVRRSLTGRMFLKPDGKPVENPDFLVFHRYAANFPWRSQAAWFADALSSAEIAGNNPSAALSAFRPALYARAAEELGVPFPLLDSKPEGDKPQPWTLNHATSPIRMGREWMFENDLPAR
jgi:nitrate/nitrite transport system substrate-binding protein